MAGGDGDERASLPGFGRHGRAGAGARSLLGLTRQGHMSGKILALRTRAAPVRPLRREA